MFSLSPSYAFMCIETRVAVLLLLSFTLHIPGLSMNPIENIEFQKDMNAVDLRNVHISSKLWDMNDARIQ